MNFVSRILMALAIATVAAQSAEPTGFMIYREPPGSYIEAFEVVSVLKKNLFDSTVILPNGRSQSCKTGGILALVKYPPQTILPDFETEASSYLRYTESIVNQFPQFRVNLEVVQNKWQNALAVSKKIKAAQPAPQKSTPAADSCTFVTTLGTKFEKVTILGIDGTGIKVATDSGIVHVPFEQLPKDMQARFHYEPSKAMVASKSSGPSTIIAQAATSSSRPPESTVDRNVIEEGKRQKVAQARQEKDAIERTRLRNEREERLNQWTLDLPIVPQENIDSSANPGYLTTVEFINGMIVDGSPYRNYPLKLWFGRENRKMIIESAEELLVFDPASLNPDVKFCQTANGAGRYYITISCTNGRRDILVVSKFTEKQRQISDFRLFTSDNLNRDKLLKAFTHLIEMFGGKQDDF